MQQSESSARSERMSAGFKFPVLLDMDGVAGLDYKVFSLPKRFFVNKDGIIVEQVQRRTLNQLEENLRN